MGNFSCTLNLFSDEIVSELRNSAVSFSTQLFVAFYFLSLFSVEIISTHGIFTKNTINIEHTYTQYIVDIVHVT